jgi:signal recognition particle GTPase
VPTAAIVAVEACTRASERKTSAPAAWWAGLVRAGPRGDDGGGEVGIRRSATPPEARISKPVDTFPRCSGLSDKLSAVFRKLKGEGKITEDDLRAALREIRVALLEADVHFRVVKELLTRVEERALGAKVIESLSPAQQVIAIVRDELTATLGGEDGRALAAPRR